MNSEQKRKTRSDLDLHVQIKDVKFFKSEVLDHRKPQMLPTYRHLYERFLTMKSKHTNMPGFGTFVIQSLASEFIFDWVMMNIYTITFKSVCKKFDKILKSFTTVKDYPESKKHCKAYNEKADSILFSLDHGIDIFCNHESSRKKQETEFGIKMTEQEHQLYADNTTVSQ